jgi:hypothetical protein
MRRRRSAAISETHARRPQAEAESSAFARRSLLDQINEEAAKVATDFNSSYHAQLRDPRINVDRSAPEVRVRTADQRMRWECLLEGPDALGVYEARDFDTLEAGRRQPAHQRNLDFSRQHLRFALQAIAGAHFHDLDAPGFHGIEFYSGPQVA